MEEKTNFAPAERSTQKEIMEEFELVGSQKFFHEIFGTLTGIGGVIDKNRQIVYANKEFLGFLGISSLEPLLGKRPGEAISCINSTLESGGCGTSAACAYCGAVNAILESQITGKKSTKETRISTISDGKQLSLDLKISSTPISLAGKVFYVLVLQDISNEKRRLALERIFFHDLLNSTGGLNGLLTMLKEGTSPEAERELINMSEEASRDILEEIVMQRQLLAAENGDLAVKIEKVNTINILNSALGKISSHVSGQNKKIIVDPQSADIDFDTDKSLLQRVLINLIKNAFEATKPDGTVYAGVNNPDNKLKFWVKNESVLSKEVQSQLFQRSFSTKGHDRGIGTYSVRLLTENYLNGKVGFISNEKDGTLFSILLNK